MIARGHGRPRSPRLLIGTGVALELVMAAGFLWPLSMRRVPHVVMGYQPLASALGAGLVCALRFVIPVALAGLVFGLAAWLARRTAGGHAIAVVLGGTFVLAATLLPIN